jgi:hypothetical protein
VKGTEVVVAATGPTGGPAAGAEVALLSNLNRRFFRSAAPIPILAYFLGRRHGLYDLNLLTSGLAVLESAACDETGEAVLRVPPAFWEPRAGAVQGCFLYFRADGFQPRLIHLVGPPSGRVEVSLRPLGVCVRGTVEDEEGAPVAGCFVVAAGRNPGEDEGLMLIKTSGTTGEMTGLSRPWYAGPTGADGRFLLPLPEGETVLKYLACIKPGRLPTIRYDVSVADLGSDARIRLARGRPFRGAVFGRAGRLEAFTVTAGNLERRNLPDGWFDMIRGRGDGDGFVLEGAGTHGLYVRVDAPGYAPTMTTIRRGNWLSDVAFTFRLEPGRDVVGRVFDLGTERGVEDVEVLVVTGFSSNQIGNPDFTVRRRARTDAAGVFVVENVPEGGAAGKVYAYRAGRLVGSRKLPRGGEEVRIGILEGAAGGESIEEVE